MVPTPQKLGKQKAALECRSGLTNGQNLNAGYRFGRGDPNVVPKTKKNEMWNAIQPCVAAALNDRRAGHYYFAAPGGSFGWAVAEPAGKNNGLPEESKTAGHFPEMNFGGNSAVTLAQIAAVAGTTIYYQRCSAAAFGFDLA